MRTLLLAFSVLGLFYGPSSQAEGHSTLMVGIASKDITPEVGVPVGGVGGGGRRLGFPFIDLFNKHPYATFFFPSDGVLDPLRAKAMVLQNGDKKLVFISLDMIGVMKELHDDLIELLSHSGFSKNEIIVGATHTHSGPGAVIHNKFWELVIMDRFKKKVYRPFIVGIVQAVIEAKAKMKPAQLFATSFVAQDLQNNRRGKEGHFDPQANLLLAQAADGTWLGGMTNLPIHGTALNGKNHKFSADVPGGMERSLEGKLDALNQQKGSSQKTTLLFFNGAEGDVAPKHGQIEGIERIGKSFADQAEAALAGIRPIQPQWSVQSTEVDLGNADLFLKQCSSESMRKWIFHGLHVGLGVFLPRKLPVSVIRLGDMMMATWPGEPTSSLGFETKKIAMEKGAQQAWVLGLTSGYVAYFTTQDEFFEGTYESCNTLYGSRAGEKILNAIQSLAN